jgi:EAL domain-containing protein (putative c-di-GMP-specific phosphodiesterase class I)
MRRQTINIGPGGLFIEMPTPLPEGVPVRLRFALPGQAESMTVEAAVAWAEPQLGMGLRFTWLEPPDRAAIRRYIAARLQAAAGRPSGDAELQEPPAVLTGTDRASPPDGYADGERLPSALPGAGILYVALPPDASKAGVREFLATKQIAHTEPYRDLLAIPLTQGMLPSLSAAFRQLLSAAELQRHKSLVLTEGVGPSLAELVRMQPLSTLVAKVEGGWLLTMLRDGRLVSHFQPIVHADRPDTVFGYEALVRGREGDGALVEPKRLYEAARSADLLLHLDRLARLMAIRGAVAHNLTTRLFINVNPASIDDPGAHLQATVKAIEESGMSPERIVFEIVESDRIKDIKYLLGILDSYRSAGFGVALDDLGAGYSSLNLLAQLRPDFVKLDMELVRNVDADPYRAEIVAKLLESARNLGIRTVAEGVESDAEWRWFREHRVDFVQGYLFAEPGESPPTPRASLSRLDGR